MKMDIYRQHDSQDANTGAIKKEWQFYKTVDCHAKGIISNSATTRGSDKQVMNTRYSNEQLVQARTAEKISIRDKITNVRDSKDNVIWTELDYPTETPTVFEAIGTTPLTDPFGRVIGFSITLKRSENQQIGF
jgi:hypothetical protein